MSDAISKEKVYDSLRVELLSISERQFNSFALSITASGTILGLATQASTNKALLALIPIVILSAIGTQLSKLAQSHMRIANYIRCFLESDQSFPQWETYMTMYRKVSKLRGWRSWPEYQSVIIFMGLVCLVVALILHQTYSELWIVLLTFFYWLFYSVWIIRALSRATQGKLDIPCEELKKEILGS